VSSTTTCATSRIRSKFETCWLSSSNIAAREPFVSLGRYIHVMAQKPAG
jgi:hypothetical protein